MVLVLQICKAPGEEASERSMRSKNLENEIKYLTETRMLGLELGLQ